MPKIILFCNLYGIAKIIYLKGKRGFWVSEKMQQKTNWIEHKKRLEDAFNNSQMLKQAELVSGVLMVNSNDWFNVDLDLFVDHVHLTDLGYKILAENINEVSLKF